MNHLGSNKELNVVDVLATLQPSTKITFIYCEAVLTRPKRFATKSYKRYLPSQLIFRLCLQYLHMEVGQFSPFLVLKNQCPVDTDLRTWDNPWVSSLFFAKACPLCHIALCSLATHLPHCNTSVILINYAAFVSLMYSLQPVALWLAQGIRGLGCNMMCTKGFTQCMAASHQVSRSNKKRAYIWRGNHWFVGVACQPSG